MNRYRWKGLIPRYERPQDAVAANANSFVLFPAEGATTFPALTQALASTSGASSEPDPNTVYDIIVLDGTWEQARKFNSKVPEHVRHLRIE